MGEQLQQEQEEETVLDIIRRLAVELNDENTPESVTDESTLEVLGLDSLDLVEVVTTLGDEKGIDVDKSEFRDKLKDAQTVGQLVVLFEAELELPA